MPDHAVEVARTAPRSSGASALASVERRRRARVPPGAARARRGAASRETASISRSVGRSSRRVTGRIRTVSASSRLRRAVVARMRSPARTMPRQLALAAAERLEHDARVAHERPHRVALAVERVEHVVGVGRQRAAGCPTPRVEVLAAALERHRQAGDEALQVLPRAVVERRASARRAPRSARTCVRGRWPPSAQLAGAACSRASARCRPRRAASSGAGSPGCRAGSARTSTRSRSSARVTPGCASDFDDHLARPARPRSARRRCRPAAWPREVGGEAVALGVERNRAAERRATGRG